MQSKSTSLSILILLSILAFQTVGCVEHHTPGSGDNSSKTNNKDECTEDSQCEGLTSKCSGRVGSRKCVRAYGLNDGDACKTDGDCAGGKCLEQGNGDWVDGHCTTLGCQEAKDCSTLDVGSTVCVKNVSPEQNMCMRSCSGNDECRYGYYCKFKAPGDDKGICAPNTFTTINDAYFKDNDKCKKVKKGVLNTIDFELPAEVKDGTRKGSYYLTVWTRLPSNIITPVQLISPSDYVLDFFNSGSFTQKNHASSMEYRDITALQIPLGDGQDQLVVPGTSHYTYRLKYDDTVCYHVSHKTPDQFENSKTINYDVYLVGVKDPQGRNISAKEAYKQLAGKTGNLHNTFDFVRDLYKKNTVGFDVGEIRFFDVEPWVLKRYSDLRAPTVGTGTPLSSLFDLVRTSKLQQQGNTLTEGDRYTVSLFLVNSIDLSVGGYYGFSPGLPGLPGIKGTKGSGVVVGTSMLNNSSFYDEQGDTTVGGYRIVGQVIAHETGHFLGLFHTTEPGLRGFDDLKQTPQCTDKEYWTNFARDCPDHINLMFPFASTRSTELERSQVNVMKASPTVLP